MSNEDLKSKAFDFFSRLTWKRLIISIIAGAFAISMFTLYENRQTLFDQAKTGLNSTVDDLELKAPGKVGQALIQEFMKKHPEVLMLSLLDANPLSNQRIVVYRAFNSAQLEAEVLSQTLKVPTAGDGPLFTNDPENNKQVLAILNGEFYCSPPTGILLTAFPEQGKLVKQQCRVPLPPSFGKATGWMTLHMRDWPMASYDLMKNDSLVLSLEYYRREVGAP